MRKEVEVIKKIDECRKLQGMTKKELAEKLGCSVRLVHYWFRGERGISVDMADKALKLLKTTVELGIENGS